MRSDVGDPFVPHVIREGGAPATSAASQLLTVVYSTQTAPIACGPQTRHQLSLLRPGEGGTSCGLIATAGWWGPQDAGTLDRAPAITGVAFVYRHVSVSPAPPPRLSKNLIIARFPGSGVRPCASSQCKAETVDGEGTGVSNTNTPRVAVTLFGQVLKRSSLSFLF